jgi:hypothetical protein
MLRSAIRAPGKRWIGTPGFRRIRDEELRASDDTNAL